MKSKIEIIEDIVMYESELERIYIKKEKLSMGFVFPEVPETLQELLDEEEKLVDRITDLKKLLTEY